MSHHGNTNGGDPDQGIHQSQGQPTYPSQEQSPSSKPKRQAPCTPQDQPQGQEKSNKVGKSEHYQDAPNPDTDQGGSGPYQSEPPPAYTSAVEEKPKKVKKDKAAKSRKVEKNTQCQGHSGSMARKGMLTILSSPVGASVVLISLQAHFVS